MPGTGTGTGTVPSSTKYYLDRQVFTSTDGSFIINGTEFMKDTQYTIHEIHLMDDVGGLSGSSINGHNNEGKCPIVEWVQRSKPLPPLRLESSFLEVRVWWFDGRRFHVHYWRKQSCRYSVNVWRSCSDSTPGLWPDPLPLCHHWFRPGRESSTCLDSALYM